MSERSADVLVTQYCVGFLFCGEDVLLIEKRRPKWQAGKLNGVGGHVEPGETPGESMVREFGEETGWEQGQPFWEHMVTLTGDDRDPARQAAGGGNFEVWFYRAEWTGTRATIPQLFPGDEPLQWVSAKSLPENVLPNLRWLVPMAFQAHRYDWPFLVVECGGVRG